MLIFFLVLYFLLLTLAGCSNNCKLPNARPHKTLIAVDISNVESIRTWAKQYYAVCEDFNHLEILCMDDHVIHRLADIDPRLQCSTRHGDILTANYTTVNVSDPIASKSQIVSAVWLKRMEVIIRLLTGGEDVIVSDTDALWMKNPYPELSFHLSSRMSHVIASRGWFPYEVSRVWGTTLCMGFIYFQSHSATLELLLRVQSHMLSFYSEFIAYWGSTVDWRYNRFDKYLVAANDELSLNVVFFDYLARGSKANREKYLNGTLVNSVHIGKSALDFTLLHGSKFILNPQLSGLSSDPSSDAVICRCDINASNSAQRTFPREEFVAKRYGNVVEQNNKAGSEQPFGSAGNGNYRRTPFFKHPNPLQRRPI